MERIKTWSSAQKDSITCQVLTNYQWWPTKHQAVINHDHERISTAEYLQAASPNIREKKRMQPGKGCIAKSFPASRQDHHAAAAPPQFCCVRLITIGLPDCGVQ